MFNLQVVKFNKSNTFGKIETKGYSHLNREQVSKILLDETWEDESINIESLIKSLILFNSHTVVMKNVTVTFILNHE